MQKTNDEILAEYQERFFELVEQVGLAGGDVGKLQSSGVRLVAELHHIMTEYRADPAKPLLMAKLAFDAEDYREMDPKQRVRMVSDLVTWWGNWKAGALFI